MEVFVGADVAFAKRKEHRVLLILKLRLFHTGWEHR